MFQAKIFILDWLINVNHLSKILDYAFNIKLFTIFQLKIKLIENNIIHVRSTKIVIYGQLRITKTFIFCLAIVESRRLYRSKMIW